MTSHRVLILSNATDTDASARCECGWECRYKGASAKDRANAAIQRHYDTQGLHTTPKGETLKP